MDVEVGDVAIAFLGVNSGRAALSRTTTTSSSAGEVPLVNIKDLRDGEVRPASPLPLVVSSTSERSSLKLGDVLVSVRGTLLKMAIVGEEHVGALASSNLAVLRARQESIYPDVLYALLAAPHVQESLLQQATGTVINGLQIGALKRVRFKLPPLAQQAQVAELVRLSRDQRRVLAELSDARGAEALGRVARLLGVADDNR